MVGRKIGGVNVFGGGVALYRDNGDLIGALGVSGSSSCTDHIIAWKVRDILEMDNVPAGVDGAGADNMIFDISEDMMGHAKSAGGFGHPECGFAETPITEELHDCYPIGGVMGPQAGVTCQ